jgi:hypothetical protein
MIFSRSLVFQALLATGILGFFLTVSAESFAGSKRTETRKPVLTNPKFDPTAERVGLFEGMEDGRVETKVIAKDATGGFVIVSNNSDQPLTVELPDSFVAVPVLKQLGGMGGMGGMGGGMGGMGGMGGQQGGGQNQAQGGGFGGGGQQGGMGGMGGGMGGMGGGGGGFFSVPPEKSVKVPYVGACLNHGKADPSPRVEYKLVRVADYTQDPVLAELIRMVGSGRVEQHSAQAAIWTRTDNMSWQDLANESTRSIGGGRDYFFKPANIMMAQNIFVAAEARVRETAEKGKTSEPAEVLSPRVR